MTPPDWDALTNEGHRIRLGSPRLTARALNVLRTLGIHDMDGLLSLSMERLTAAKNCGPGTLATIKRAIADLLCPPDPEDLTEAIDEVRRHGDHRGQSVAWRYARTLLAEVDRLHREAAK